MSEFKYYAPDVVHSSHRFVFVAKNCTGMARLVLWFSIKKWISQNISKRAYHFPVPGVIHLDRDEDAVLFKLTWLDVDFSDE